MKRVELVRHLIKEGCTLIREGSRHSIFINLATRRSSSVPRHKEINNFTIHKICRDLGVTDIS